MANRWCLSGDDLKGPSDNTRTTFKRKASVVAAALLAIAALTGTCVMADEHDSQTDVLSTDMPLLWVNLDTHKTAGIPSGWTVQASFSGNQRFTLFHDEMSGAEITVNHEDTKDNLHSYVADMLKLYPKRHITITKSEFYEADVGSFWLASGKDDNAPDKILNIAIHSKEGRMWIIGQYFPEWMESNHEFNKLVSNISGTTL